MRTRGQLILLWTTPVAGLLFLLAYFMFPAFSPPMSPTMTPDEVAGFFRENVAAIRGVVILVNIIGALLVPLFASIAVQMLRVVNSSPVFAYSYIIAVGIGLSAFILADFAWGVAIYRPERDPQLISLLNDMAWFFFIAPAGTLVVQNLCLAGSIYLDARPDPVFPRWVAHFNVATAVLMIPGAFALLHKTGPLAWDGSLSFSLRLMTFAIYVAVMFFVVLGIVNRQLRGGCRMSKAVAATLPSASRHGAPWYRNRKLDQYLCFWSVPFFYNVFGLVFVPLSWMMPPRSPGSSLADKVDFMQSPNLLIACTILILSLGLAAVGNAVYLCQIKRMSVSPCVSFRVHGRSHDGRHRRLPLPHVLFRPGRLSPRL